jgi:hypothetical protein
MLAPGALTCEIVIIPLRGLDQAKISRLAKTGAFTVLFLSSSLPHFMRLQRILPRDWAMPAPGAVLNNAAARLRDIVVNLDAQIWNDPDRVSWDASLLGERGPLASTTMLNLARLKVVAELSGKPGRYLVVADDVAIGRMLLRAARQAGAAVSWSVPGHSPGLIDHIVQFGTTLRVAIDTARRRTSLVKRFFVRKLVLAWQRRRMPLPMDALRAADVLLTVWGRPDTFPTQGPLMHEHNFGRLPELLRQAGLRVVYLVYPLTYVAPARDIIRNALSAQEAVVVVDDFVPWWAGFAAALFGLGFPMRLGKLSVDNLDATDVVRAEAVRDRRLAFGAEATLLRYVGSGMARLGIRPRALIHLYEGQPWEKMLARGFAATRVIGVQNVPFAANYLSFFPSRRSIVERRMPDFLLMTGNRYVQWMIDAGVPVARVGVLGATRYEGAQELLPQGTSIVCCTGIDFDEAVELATKAARATVGLGRRLIINYHPITDQVFRAQLRDQVQQAMEQQTSHITFSTASIRDLLRDAADVLYTTSAAGFEAVRAGRRAIYVARDLQIDHDKLPEGIATRCRSVEELRRLLAVRDHVAESAEESVELSDWLSPVVDAATVKELLISLDSSDNLMSPA